MSGLPRGVTVRKDAGLYGYERALRRTGIEPIAGVDEAGRGACAGALVAGAALLPPGKAGIVPGLADSKLLTEKARERCYDQVVKRALAWSVVVVSHEECDRLGMHVANVEALRRAVALLELPPSYVLTDGFPVDGHGDVVVAGAQLVGVDPEVVGQLQARAVAGEAHEDVDGLVADRHAPELLKAQRLVERDGPVDVADAVARMDEGHAWQSIGHDRREEHAPGLLVQYVPRGRR